MKVRFVDLFAGIGGIRMGLEQALLDFGLHGECVLTSEIDTKAKETYYANFGAMPDGDIRSIIDVPDHEVLLAGFPCQPFSYAGKQKGFGDTRGTLFFEVERILAQTRPPVLLLENVRGLTTHDEGRTLQTILASLGDLGYGVRTLVLNSSDLGLPQNRMRVYIVALLGTVPKTSLEDTLKFVDTNARVRQQMSLFGDLPKSTVRSVLESEVDPKYRCSTDFTKRLEKFVNGDLSKLHGVRMIDSRNGHSIHSWDLGLRGRCSRAERDLMDALIANRRRKDFGTHQDGKALTLEQIRTFFPHSKLSGLLESLVSKGYLRQVDGRYNPTMGNMSFEVYKFVDPDSVSVTLVSSDANRLGVIDDLGPRRITPREAARLQGFPDHFVLHPNDNAAYHQLGNAVSVPVIYQILTDIFSSNLAAIPFLEPRLENPI
jgi:DNA (cytosine-5)-methyltransferase 1